MTGREIDATIAAIFKELEQHCNSADDAIRILVLLLSAFVVEECERRGMLACHGLTATMMLLNHAMKAAA